MYFRNVTSSCVVVRSHETMMVLMSSVAGAVMVADSMAVTSVTTVSVGPVSNETWVELRHLRWRMKVYIITQVLNVASALV